MMGPHYYRGVGSSLAGRDVTEELLTRINTSGRGVQITTTADREMVQVIKAQHAYVALDFEAAMRAADEAESHAATAGADVAVDVACELPGDYYLEGASEPTRPGGHPTIPLGRERFSCTELLFNPPDRLMERNQGDGVMAGLAEVAWGTLQKCGMDQDLLEEVKSGIVLAGGNCKLPGFAERMKKELRALARNADPPVNHLVFPDAAELRDRNRGLMRDPSMSVWRGAALMASSDGVFDHDAGESGGGAAITSAEYDEHGPRLVHRRFF